MAVSGANVNRVYDGQDQMLSVNSFTEPSKLRPHEIQWGFNVITRGGRVRTRFGFRSIFKFNFGKAQGLSFFIPNTGVERLVAAVSGRIYDLPDPFNSATELTNIRFNAQAPMVFFKEATVSKTPNSVVTPYPVLMMQDRYSRAAYTDGVIARHLDPTPDGFFSPVSIGANETPIGFAMEWVGDRLWVEQGRGLVASDIADPLHFTENTYLFGGGSLQAVDGALIRTLKRTADSKQLIVLTDQNTTAIAAGITDRAAWGTTPDFVRSLFPGVGCVGPKAITDASGELAWMSQEGMRLFNAVGDSVFNAKNNVASREMDRSWQARSRKFMGLSCAAYHDGYTMFGMPCGDIFNRHIWVMDNSSGDLLDQQFPYAWQGVWTGIRPVEIVSGVVNGEMRTFCMSQDRDGVRIWEMFREDRLDGDCDIICYFDSKGNVFNGETPMTFKRYKYSALHVNDLTGNANLTHKYKNEFGCFREVGEWNLCASRCNPQTADCKAGSMNVLESQRRYLKSQEAEDDCGEGGSPFRAQVGTYFTTRTSWSGRLSVRAIRHTGEQVQEPDIGECLPQEDCQFLSCCDTEPDYISCPSDAPPYSYGGYYGGIGGIVSIGADSSDEEAHILDDIFDSFWNFDETSGSALDMIGDNDVSVGAGAPGSVSGHVDDARSCPSGNYFNQSGSNVLASGSPPIFEFVGWVNFNVANFTATPRIVFSKFNANIFVRLCGIDVSGSQVYRFTLFDGAAHQEHLDIAAPADRTRWAWYSLSYNGSDMRLQVKEPIAGSDTVGTRGYTAGPLAGSAGTFAFGVHYNNTEEIEGGYLDATGYIITSQLSYFY